MKNIILIAGVTAAIASLGACADDDYARPAASVGVGVAYVGGPVGYDGFYDDYYGPYYDGYWAGDGYYYYSAGPGRPYRRDVDHHFRHDPDHGFHPVHGGMMRGNPGMHDGDHDMR